MRTLAVGSRESLSLNPLTTWKRIYTMILDVFFLHRPLSNLANSSPLIKSTSPCSFHSHRT